MTAADRETRDRLTRDVWLYQRAKGHRFSSDDVITAWVAARAVPDARTICDLGCGIGTVLLHLAWTHEDAHLVGIEAQAISFALLERNVLASGYGARIRVAHGDLRETAIAGGPFDLVTGTPPYFPPGTSVTAMDEQRAYARIEFRGGVEAYVAAAAPILAPHGTFVVCGDARSDARVATAAASAALRVTARLDVIAREGEPPLFAVWTLVHAARRAAADLDGEIAATASTVAGIAPNAGGEIAASPSTVAGITPAAGGEIAASPSTVAGIAPNGGVAVSRITLRDRAGARTADVATLRAFSGL